MGPKLALGIHIGHDRGAAMVRNGLLVAQMAEERLDRRKHSNSPELPTRAISTVLRIAGVRAEELGVVGISYTNVVIENVLSQLAAELRELLDSPAISVHGISHHDAHAWSTYCTSDYERALIFVADGAGDITDGRIEAESFYLGEGGRVRPLSRRLQDFGLTRTTRRNAFNLAYMHEIDLGKQISLGRKYEQITYLLGFGHGHAGKTMALASYAAPLFEDDIPRFSGLEFSLTFEDGLRTLDNLWQASGEPWHRFLQNHRAGIAAAGQSMIESYVLQILQSTDAREFNGRLCAAGGLFLSCRLNHCVLANTNFKSLHVIPAAGDDGQCVGAAFAAYAAEYGPPSCSSAPLPYLGRQYTNPEIQERLTHFQLDGEFMENESLVRRLALDLASGRVAGILRGRSEMGPRALCHRSLLADPRRATMKDYLNRLKGRELFRPFAPVVIAEDQFRYFELLLGSPYMLLATRVRPEYQAALPAITHVDGTARVQAISREQDGFIFDLLKMFEEQTGFPILLNTSFNLRGDPIVESPHDAIVAFLGSDIDVLILENYYVRKVNRASGDQNTGVK